MGLGLFLGSAAKSGLETYERLNAEERKQKAQTRMDEMQRREDEKYAREEAIRAAAGEVEGTGASQPVTLRHSDGRAETHKLAPDAAGGFAQAWSDYYAREGAAAEQAAARTKAISGRRDKLPTDMPGLEPVAPRVDVTAPPGEVEVGRCAAQDRGRCDAGYRRPSAAVRSRPSRCDSLSAPARQTRPPCRCVPVSALSGTRPTRRR
jgi:hypothetical protein